MQEVFQPTHQEDQLVLYVALILAIGGAAALTLTLKRKATGDAHNRNMLLAMLFFFLTMISTGAAFFSWLTMHKTGPVTLSSDAIETPYGKVAFSDIRKAEIVIDQAAGLLPVTDDRRSVKLLVLEERSGKAHVLSEKNYDIQRIFGALREAREK